MFTSIIVTFIAVDVALYFSRYKYPIFRLNYPRFFSIKDSENGYDISPNFATSTHFFRDDAFPIWSNNIGCFDRDFNGESPYIYMAGDSLTFSFAPFVDTWGSRIEDLSGVRTVKCGVVGYGTKQELIKASRNFERFPHPDLIVVGYTAYNDFDDDVNFPQHTVYNGYMVRSLTKNGVTDTEAEQKYANFWEYCSFNKPSNPIIARVRCFVTNHSVLFNLFKTGLHDKIVSVLPKGLVAMLENSGVLSKPQNLDGDKTDTEAYGKHLQNIFGFKKLAQEKNSKLLFILGPYDNSRVIPFLEKEKIPYIDLNPIFDKYKKIKPLIWTRDGHYNIAGNHLVGLVVSKYTIENNLVTVADKEGKLTVIDAQFEKEFGSLL